MAGRRALSLRIVALAKQKSTRCVGDGVTAFVVTIRPGPSERGQGNRHERGIGLFQLFISETPTLKISHRCGFDKQMSRCEEFCEDFRISGASWQIQHNTTLIRIGVYESQAAFRIFDFACKRRQQPVRIATGRFDFDDVSAQVGQQARRVGGRDIAQFNDTNVTESPGVMFSCSSDMIFFLSTKIDHDSAANAACKNLIDLWVQFFQRTFRHKIAGEIELPVLSEFLPSEQAIAYSRLNRIDAQQTHASKDKGENTHCKIRRHGVAAAGNASLHTWSI